MRGRDRTPTDPGYLRDLFGRTASSYDAVNDLISLRQVRRWRRETVALAGPEVGDRVLDAFAGPGGLAEQALPLLGATGELVLADLSPVMLHEAQRRLSPGLRRAGTGSPAVRFVSGDLLRDDLELGTFDVVLLGWGLRYVPDVEAALARLAGLLRPHGRLAILEFTHSAHATWALPAQAYFRRVLPRLAGVLSGDRELYEYLRTSSARFPNTASLVQTAGRAGLRVRTTRTHLGGQVTILVATPTSAT